MLKTLKYFNKFNLVMKPTTNTWLQFSANYNIILRSVYVYKSANKLMIKIEFVFHETLVLQFSSVYLCRRRNMYYVLNARIY